MSDNVRHPFKVSTESLSGRLLGMSWHSMVEMLIANGNIRLNKGEFVQQIQIKQDYGILVKIESE